MPSRKRPNDRVDGLRDASDPKTRTRVRKLMDALGVPEDAVEVRFVMGDEPTVIWLMDRP
jgi:hypothetical protein